MKTFELLGDVGWEITMQQVKDIVNNNKNEDIQFLISSLGGDANHGIAIHDLIKMHKGKTKCIVIGATASAGTIIAVGCDEREISENALFLIHNTWSSPTGNADELEKEAENLRKYDDIVVDIYKNDTKKLSEQEIRDLMKKGDWMSAEEAVKYGFFDRVAPAENKVAASYKNILPKKLQTKLENKMKLFKIKNDSSDEVYEMLELKNGTRLLINAAEPAKDVQFKVLGAEAAVLEDGEYELADGRMITVVGDVITAITPADDGGEEGSATEDEVLEAVATIITEKIAEVQADFTKQLNGLKSQISSKYKPPQGNINAGNHPKKSAQKQVDEMCQGIRDEIVKQRQN